MIYQLGVQKGISQAVSLYYININSCNSIKII